MASYVISGVARGLGFEFVRQLSTNPDNIIFGLVRDKVATDKKVEAELPQHKNVHIIQADVTDYETLRAAVDYVSATTGGSLEFVIASAAIMGDWSGLATFGELSQDAPRLERELLDTFSVNVIGPINLFNLFLPLLLEGKTKKAIAISSGLGDAELTAKYDLEYAGPYSISKAALNMAVAKFSAEYRERGVLFLSISPGLVDTGVNPYDTEEKQRRGGITFAKFNQYEPTFQKPDVPEDSIRAVLSVIEKSSVEGGQAGGFLSHFGNKRWL